MMNVKLNAHNSDAKREEILCPMCGSKATIEYRKIGLLYRLIFVFSRFFHKDYFCLVCRHEFRVKV